MDEGPGGCRVNYKRTVAEHVCSEAGTKDKGLLWDKERINNSTS